MTQDIHGKLNPGSHATSIIKQGEGPFHQQNGINCNEETSKALYLQHRFEWC
jgi:hypothetical protein